MPKPRLVKKLDPEKLMSMPIRNLPASPDATWKLYWWDKEADEAFMTDNPCDHAKAEANLHVVRISKYEFDNQFIDPDFDEPESLDDFYGGFSESRGFRD